MCYNAGHCCYGLVFMTPVDTYCKQPVERGQSTFPPSSALQLQQHGPYLAILVLQSIVLTSYSLSKASTVGVVLDQ